VEGPGSQWQGHSEVVADRDLGLGFWIFKEVGP
jgi:hypothetical protein